MTVRCGIPAPDATSRAPGASTVGLLVLAGLFAAAVVRQGAFFPRDAFVVAIVSVALVAAYAPARAEPRALAVTIGLLGLAGWWLVTALAHGRPSSFLPLGASVLGFAAGFLVVRSLSRADRASAAMVAASIGAASAAAGLVASTLRWSPLAISSQGLWRLATTLTYSDAAGLLLGMTALVSLGLDPRRRLARLNVTLCVAGLVATQSRGAVLAALLGVLFVPAATLRAARWSLLAALAAGLLVVGTSAGPGRQPLAAVGALALIAVGTLVRPSRARGHLDRRRALVLAAASLVGLGLVAAALHTPIERRLQLGSTSGRVAEWRAALDQWASSPWVGVGPDVVLRVHVSGGSYAHFAHDEYLQIAADAGLIGELLVLGAAGALVLALRREDALGSCASGAVAAFAAAAVLDFDWHLAALGLLGGWAAGLAGGPREGAERTRAAPAGPSGGASPPVVP